MERLVLCRRINGQLILDERNIDKVFQIPKFNPENPVAIISFIGGKGSGITTHANLLIQNLRNNSTNGWLQKVELNSNCRSVPKPLPGFPNQNDTCNTISEISIWPECYLMHKYKATITVLILHVHYANNDLRYDDIDSLEVFLSLVSSKVVEIQWENQQEFRFLDLCQRLRKYDENFFNEILCNSFVYILRTNTKVEGFKHNKATQEEAVKWLRNYTVKYKSHQPGIEKCERIGIARIPNSHSYSLQNQAGFLIVSEEMHDALYDSTNLIADDEETSPKTISSEGFNKKKELLLGKHIKEFLQVCCSVSNTFNEKQELLPTFYFPNP